MVIGGRPQPSDGVIGGRDSRVVAGRWELRQAIEGDRADELRELCQHVSRLEGLLEGQGLAMRQEIKEVRGEIRGEMDGRLKAIELGQVKLEGPIEDLREAIRSRDAE